MLEKFWKACRKENKDIPVNALNWWENYIIAHFDQDLYFATYLSIQMENWIIDFKNLE